MDGMEIREGLIYTLKNVREARGLTRQELAERAVLPPTMVVAWERPSGPVVKSAETALRLCRALEVPPEQVVELASGHTMRSGLTLDEEMDRIAELYGLSEWLNAKREQFMVAHRSRVEPLMQEIAQVFGTEVDS